ncbi:AEC family transporter [Botrimarina mediterranea]|uniref:Membrane transport protein n=1 Tax=Botrimarina mediterranea TaxID=2528022 RepID=A0A518K9A7_9BACT|nr:AEC family transporter [Botrimarina mediterranea]QDV74372.1 Membrane transport protein [Botrimarina mediterranea]
MSLALSLEQFQHLAQVLLPIFGMLLLGVAAKRYGFPGDGFWVPAERLTYFAMFPALIASTLASADLSELPWRRMGLGIAGAIAIVTLLALALRRLIAIDGPRFTSLYQGSVRMNTYVGLAVAMRWAGPEALAYAAVAIGVIVPLVNLVCVWMLAELGDQPGGGSVSVWRQVATNPLILGSAVGVALNASGIGEPPVLGDLAQMLSKAALPMGLLAVGAFLSWEAIAACRLLEALATFVKLLALPALTAALMTLMGVDGVARGVGVLFTALPTATSSYLLARQMGGDAEKMAALITAQTALALFTLPIVMIWLA